MFKIALNAGHGLYTAGKRCLKSIDPNETREWTLNSRICNKIESKLKATYTGYELIRLDDTTGKTDVSLPDRTNKANSFGADFYLAIHHNAGINGKSGGGLETYTYLGTKGTTKEWQIDLYNTCIKYTGLKGNRSNGVCEKDLHEVRESHMPAVLIECGFMDSPTDTPIILTDKFAEQIADACVEVLAKRGKLIKKNVTPLPSGSVDVANETTIAGWAYNNVNDTPVEVHIYGYKDGKQVFGIPKVMANIYRQDLELAKKGNGKHGFVYNYDLSKYGDGTYTIKCYAIGVNTSNVKLNNEFVITTNANALRKAQEEAEEKVRIEAEQKAREEKLKAEQTTVNTVDNVDINDLDETQKSNLLSLLLDFIKKAINIIFKK